MPLTNPTIKGMVGFISGQVQFRMEALAEEDHGTGRPCPLGTAPSAAVESE